MGFHENVSRPADHDEVFDIVAPYEHQLTLTVERICIDEAEARLSRAPARGNAQAMPKHESVEEKHNQYRGDRRDDDQPGPMKVWRPDIR